MPHVISDKFLAQAAYSVRACVPGNVPEPPRAHNMTSPSERGEIMENAVYWQGRQVGIECAEQILWFSSAPKPAMEAYGPQTHAQVQTATVGGDIARNLLKVAN